MDWDRLRDQVAAICGELEDWFAHSIEVELPVTTLLHDWATVRRWAALESRAQGVLAEPYNYYAVSAHDQHRYLRYAIHYPDARLQFDVAEYRGQDTLVGMQRRTFLLPNIGEPIWPATENNPEWIDLTADEDIEME